MRGKQGKRGEACKRFTASVKLQAVSRELGEELAELRVLRSSCPALSSPALGTDTWHSFSRLGYWRTQATDQHAAAVVPTHTRNSHTHRVNIHSRKKKESD